MAHTRDLQLFIESHERKLQAKITAVAKGDTSILGAPSHNQAPNRATWPMRYEFTPHT